MAQHLLDDGTICSRTDNNIAILNGLSILYIHQIAIEQEAPTSKSARFKWREHVTKRQAQIRPAAEAMLAKAEDIAAGKAEYATYEDVFGTED